MAQRKPVHRGPKGKFVRVEGAGNTRSLTTGKRTYASLRGVAMRLIGHLERSLPTIAPKDAKEPKAEAVDDKKEGVEDKVERDGPDEMVEWTAADYERLFGRNGGVVDSFKTLAELIVRLFEVEIAGRGTTGSKYDFTEDDEAELDRRITLELDRLAERRRPSSAA
jgi:hypothetical protein